MKLTFLSDLLVSNYRVLEALRVQIVFVSSSFNDSRVMAPGISTCQGTLYLGLSKVKTDLQKVGSEC